jgi:hypothetical protein
MGVVDVCDAHEFDLGGWLYRSHDCVSVLKAEAQVLMMGMGRVAATLL